MYHIELILILFSGIQLSDKVVKEMTKRCASLIAVSFSFVEIAVDSLKEFFQHTGPHLESISIGWINTFGSMQQPTAEFIFSIVQSSPRLTRLDVTGT